MKIIPKMVFCTLFCLCLMGGLPSNWQRVEAGSGSIKIEAHYNWDDKPQEAITGDYFSLFKIATLQDHHYVNEGAFQTFQDIPLDRTGESERALVSALSQKIIKEKIAPLQEGLTDHDGELWFTGLEEGLYLIQKDVEKSQNKAVISDSFLIDLPLKESGGVLYEITVMPKYSPNDGDAPVMKEDEALTGSKNAETGLEVIDQRIGFAGSMGLLMLVLSLGLAFKVHYTGKRDQ